MNADLKEIKPEDKVPRASAVSCPGKFLCEPLWLFAYFAVKKPGKQSTAKTAKFAKITRRVEVGTLPSFLISSPLFAS
jgi:hypothetical protein